MIKTKSGSLNGDDYRKGALERLDDALILLRAGQFSGSVSDAGRAVEGMLRAVIWKRDADIRTGRKSLDTGHNFRELIMHVRNLGLLAALNPEKDNLEDKVMDLGRLWFNNIRFASSKFVETRWLRLGEVNKRRSFKQAAEIFYLDCARVLQRCEILCQK